MYGWRMRKCLVAKESQLALRIRDAVVHLHSVMRFTVRTVE